MKNTIQLTNNDLDRQKQKRLRVKKMQNKCFNIKCIVTWLKFCVKKIIFYNTPKKTFQQIHSSSYNNIN